MKKGNITQVHETPNLLQAMKKNDERCLCTVATFYGISKSDAIEELRKLVLGSGKTDQKKDFITTG